MRLPWANAASGSCRDARVTCIAGACQLLRCQLPAKKRNASNLHGTQSDTLPDTLPNTLTARVLAARRAPQRTLGPAECKHRSLRYGGSKWQIKAETVSVFLKSCLLSLCLLSRILCVSFCHCLSNVICTPENALEGFALGRRARATQVLHSSIRRLT